MDISNFISGGYRVTKFADGASLNSWMRAVEHITEDLLPDRILSIGLCGVKNAPIFDWVVSSDDYAQFGITEHLGELKTWADERYKTALGYPDVFFDLATAREYVRRFTNVPDVQILGVGVHINDLPLLTEAELWQPDNVFNNRTIHSDFSSRGFGQALKLAQPCAAGEVVGFDVVCYDFDIDHSWHCNALAVTALKEFHFRPNQFGLIDDKANADKLVQWINEQEFGPEAGVWLPVLVTRYALDD